MNRTALYLAIASVGSIAVFACGASPADPVGAGNGGADVDASVDANLGAVSPPGEGDAGHDSGPKGADASSDTGGGTVCASGMKSCGDRCVLVSDPATGCAANDCSPCSFKNAGATCDSAGACAIGACAAGFSDCNTDAKDGCEIDITKADHCGSCSKDCGTIANGQVTCAANQCVSECGAGFHTCGPTCAANTDVNNCGNACGVACSGAPNASATCNGTSCGYACSGGYTDCNSAASDGCEAHFADDPNNCGSCGHSCQGGTCNAGQCQPVVLASGRNTPYRTYVVDNSLIYTTVGDHSLFAGSIESVPLAGGAPPKTISSADTNPIALSVVGTDVYWLNGGAGFGGGAEINHCPIAGCSNAGFIPYKSLTFPATDMLLFGASLYVAATKSSANSQIYSVATSAGIASAASSTELFAQVASDGTNIYWTDQASSAFGAVYRCKPSACASTLTQVATGQSTPYGIVVDSSYVYWSSLGDGSINRCPLNATTPCTASSARLIAGEHGPYHLAVDGSGIYWATYDDGTIRKMPLAGAPATTLATGQFGAEGISLDAATVYWVASQVGTVMKIAK